MQPTRTPVQLLTDDALLAELDVRRAEEHQTLGVRTRIAELELEWLERCWRAAS